MPIAQIKRDHLTPSPTEASKRPPSKYSSPHQEQVSGSELHHKCEQILAQKDKEIHNLKNHIRTLLNNPNITEEEYDHGDIQELDSEISLVGACVEKLGFNRTNPQGPSHSIIKCSVWSHN